jgi:hypothetical protein
MTSAPIPHGPLRSFGRIKSRPVKPRQQALLDTLLPEIAVPQGPFQPLDLMPDAKAVWLEIGFGGGEHMATQAGRHPEALVIGAEPFVNGVASAVRHVEEQALKNVRVHEGDARDVVDWLPDVCLDRVFIMFPDPTGPTTASGPPSGCWPIRTSASPRPALIATRSRPTTSPPATRKRSWATAPRCSWTSSGSELQGLSSRV